MSIAVLALPAKAFVAGGCRSSACEKGAGLGSPVSCSTEPFQARSKMDLPGSKLSHFLNCAHCRMFSFLKTLPRERKKLGFAEGFSFATRRLHWNGIGKVKYFPTDASEEHQETPSSEIKTETPDPKTCTTRPSPSIFFLYFVLFLPSLPLPLTLSV